jgi:hypothetical protein
MGKPQGEVGVAEGERLSRLRRELLSACQRDQLLPSSQRDQLLPTLDQREGTAAVKSGSSSCQLSITVSNCYPRLRYRIKAGRLYFHRKGLFIFDLFFQLCRRYWYVFACFSIELLPGILESQEAVMSCVADPNAGLKKVTVEYN